MTASWVGVRQRLERLRGGHAACQAGNVFGANGHKFEVLSSLSEADLDEAETQFGVRFPEEYRGFLTRCRREALVPTTACSRSYATMLANLDAGEQDQMRRLLTTCIASLTEPPAPAT